MNITVVIPTISGRELSLACVLANYEERSGAHPLQLVTPRDYPSWGAGCNAGRAAAEGDVIHFGNDDLEPLPGWADAMLATLEAGEVPAPQVWNHIHEGEPADLHTDGPAGSLTEFSRVPALTREMDATIGPWPDLHYYCDNWLSAAARKHGWPTRVTSGYRFVHHWHQHGRVDGPGWHERDWPRYQAALSGL